MKFKICPFADLSSYLQAYLNFLSKFAPLIRNEKIVNEADVIIAIWDGKSHGTKYTIDYSHEQKKKVKIFLI